MNSADRKRGLWVTSVLCEAKSHDTCADVSAWLATFEDQKDMPPPPPAP